MRHRRRCSLLTPWSQRLNFETLPCRREIFGPILPVLPVDSVDDAIELINSRWVCFLCQVIGLVLTSRCRDHPLAVYVFTKDAKFKAKGVSPPASTNCDRAAKAIASVFDNTQSGAAIANEVVIHLAGAWPPSTPSAPQLIPSE